ncbi:MAG TPA: TIGR03435 family protein, partial [Verrucomicrobiae bacterium]|nr:TIGR03435 family protein [Verrucomicrobiae bacterium]
QRAETRRVRREQEAFMESKPEESPTDNLWRELSPQLDEAVAGLGTSERDALVLRYFQNKSMAEVAKFLGLAENTAQKRVSRALEKLRKFFTKRGVDSTAAGIAENISAHSVQAVPVALAKSVTAAALAKGATASTSTLTLIKGALKIMAWTKAKTAIAVGVGLLLAAGTTTVTVKKIEAHQADESWRVQPNFDSRILDRASPQVRIIPTKFPRFGGYGESNGKIMGLGAPVKYVVEAAYNFGANRTIFSTELPTEQYDFIASRPVGNAEVLRQEIQKQFGLVGHTEMIETNVLLLEVRSPNAPGLIRSTKHYGGMSAGKGFFKCDGQSLSSLAGCLESHFGIPVIDRTDLKGSFDIDLKWRDSDDLKGKLLDQLGLELVPAQDSVEMFVVEKAD